MSDPAAAWRQAVRSVVDRQLAGQRENIVGLEASMARLRAIREEVADAELRTALAALEREGWVLAPKEATAEMGAEGNRHREHPVTGQPLEADPWDIYAAMLSARPAIVPAQEV